MSKAQRLRLGVSVAVAALGYFVDLYDIVIFGVVRVASLQALGLEGPAVTEWGIRLLNLQMIGMLLGGVAWGLAADRYGRRPILFATIATYSVANLANAAVDSIAAYALLRFLAGFGLAGELGIGVTLVAEALPARRRGWGATVIAVMGLLGALSASYVGGDLSWRAAYLAGGGLGLLVLTGRFFGVEESRIFRAQQTHASATPLPALLRAPVLARLCAVVLVGVPIWYVSALFVNLAPETGRALAVAAPLSVAEVLRWQAFGLALGSALVGAGSEFFGNRRFVIATCFVGLVVGIGFLYGARGLSPAAYGAALFFLGLAQGYWTPFVTLAAEQFGADIRATAATVVPNLVRGATVPVTLAWQALAPRLGPDHALLALGLAIMAAAFLALARLQETYGWDLDYRGLMTAEEARRLLAERHGTRQDGSRPASYPEA